MNTLQTIEFFKNELGECVYYILKDPTAIDVDYHFYRIDEIVSVLKDYVSTCTATQTNDTNLIS